MCGDKYKAYTGPEKEGWVFHESGEAPGTADSICLGTVCTVVESEERSCAMVKPDPDDRNSHGPPPPYPLGGPKTGETEE